MSKWAALNENYQITSLGTEYAPFLPVEVPDIAQMRDAFYETNLYVNPGHADNVDIFYDNYALFWVFDGLDINNNPIWTFNNEFFMNEQGYQRLSEYRDSLLNQIVEWENEEEEIFSLKNDERTRANLGNYETIIKLRDDPLFSIRFKTEEGFKTMTGSDVQGLFNFLMAEVAKVFDAEDITLQQNIVSPFTKFEDMVTYFNSQLV